MATPKKLAFIQLANAKGDIYTPSGATKGVVHNIIFCNINNAVEDVTLYLHDGVNEYKLIDALPLPASPEGTLCMEFPGEGIVVENGAKLTGNAETAAKVTCLVCGSEV